MADNEAISVHIVFDETRQLREVAAIFEGLSSIIDMAAAEARPPSVEVTRIRKESPLEVTMWITGVGGSLTYLANRLLGVANNWQDSKVKRAAANAEVAAQEARKILLENLSDGFHRGRQEATAAFALSHIQDMQVQAQRSRETEA
ncbi:hypothetical protein [Cumulibacter manganitolerans]|uniref:hypothetical protein n=1 Tax=Cumulibacter manganitolerans TaxID=1884992 RepID=UPI0012971ABE|nr:hypothetical protein [Cumulibacter manganitolerans]